MTAIIERSAAQSAAPRPEPFLDLMLAAGYDTFEFSIMEPAGICPYVVSLWQISDGTWKAEIEDREFDGATMARGAGKTATEAVWNLTSLFAGDDGKWAGDTSTIPARLNAAGLYLWAAQTRAVAVREATEAKDSAKRAAEAQAAVDRLEADPSDIHAASGVGFVGAWRP